MHFVLQNVLAVAIAAATGRLAASDREPWRRALTALVAYGVAVSGTMMAVGLTVGFGNVAVEALLAAVAAPLAVLAWRKGPPPAPSSATAGSRERLAAAVLGAAVAVWLAGSTFFGTRFGIDDLTYHAAVPAHWLTQGRIDLAPFSYQSYYPMNAELLTLWFLLPFRADAWAGLGDLYGWLLLAAAGYGLTRSLGGTAASGMWAAALASVSRDMLLRVGVFAQPDVVGAGMALAALALLAPAAAALSWIEVGLAGLAIGFAVGCKVSYATVLAAIALWWLLDGTGGGIRGRAARLLPMLAAAVLAGGFWYARNLLLTGNPVYPAALGPLPGPLDAAAQARTKLWTWIVSSPGGAGAWSEGASRLLNWPATLAILALAGMAWSAVRLARRRAGPHAGFQSLLLGAALVQLAQFPFLPFSGTFNRPLAGLEGIATRALILPFALGIALLGGIEGPRVGRIRLVDLLALLGLAGCLPALAGVLGGPAPAFGIVAAGALAGIVLARDDRLRRRIASPAAALTLIAAGLVACAVATPPRQRATDANLFAVARADLPVGEGWRALETLPAGSRVAFFMAEPFDYTHAYPIFGRGLQLTPVPLERDGASRVPLHRRPPARWWSEWDALDDPLDPAVFQANLTRSRVDFVMVTRWTLGRWPAQREALRGAGAAPPVYADACTEIWKARESR